MESKMVLFLTVYMGYIYLPQCATGGMGFH